MQHTLLHKLGASEGDAFRYKPAVCSLFPIQKDDDGNWNVRQFGHKKEKWDLFCLDPKNGTRHAAQTIRDEISLARHFDDEEQAANSDQTD